MRRIHLFPIPQKSVYALLRSERNRDGMQFCEEVRTAMINLFAKAI